MAILIRPIPGKNGVREKLFKLIDHLGIGENALRPFRREGGRSVGGEVIECSEDQLEQLQSSNVLKDDFVAYSESPGGRLTKIRPQPPAQRVATTTSVRSREQKIADALAIPGVKRGSTIPPPRCKKHS